MPRSPRPRSKIYRRIARNPPSAVVEVPPVPPVQVLPEQFGRYRILRKVGEGGMAAVYLAEDSLARRQVALKVPHFTAEEKPLVIERFYREARTATGIDHPYLCPVYDVGQIEGIHYL